jgi:predicted RNA-binding Zn ribbon-like protein
MLKALRERAVGQDKRVGGRLCLDFANSVGGWTPSGAGLFDVRDDRLVQYVDLAAWAWHGRLLDDASAVSLSREGERRSTEVQRVLKRARRLRAAVHAIAWNLAHGKTASTDDLLVLESEVRIARDHQRLDASAGKLGWRIEDEGKALDFPLWLVALSAEGYFTTGDLTRLRACPGEECGWMFEDTTRNRSRQWCDMGDCGNVAKVRRFRSRQARRRRTGRSGSATR